MKKILFLTSFCAFLYADFNGKFTNQTMNLMKNEDHKAIIDCNNPQECTFNYNGSNGGYNFTLNGNGHTLTITRQDPSSGVQPSQKPSKDVPIYFDALEQNGGTFDIKNFDYFIGNTLTMSNKAKLIFTGNNKPGKGFSTHNNIALNDSTLEVKNVVGGFGTSGKFSATNGSKVNIETTTTFTQDATIDKSSFTTKDLIISGKEKKVTGDELKLATLTNNGGIITVNGDLKNGYFQSGGGNQQQICAMMGTCGNGKIINNGGSITVTGRLTNESFKDTTNNTHSGLEIQGGTVTVQGGMENKQDSSIKFTQNNGQMGQLIVNGTGLNNQGSIEANINGLNQQGNIDLIRGNITGKTDITISGGTNMTQTLTCPDGSIMVGMQGQTLTCPTTGGGSGGGQSGGGSGGGGNPQVSPQIQQLEKLVYGNSANANGRALLRSLAMDEIVKPGTSRNRRATNQGAINNFFVVSSYNANVLADIIDDADKGIRMSYLSLPNASLDAMRDREWLNGGREYANFDLSTFGSGFLGEGQGYTFGVRMNAYKEFNDNLLRFEGDFGYSSLLKRDDYHKASSKGRIFGLGLSQYYDFGAFETHNRLYVGYGNFDTSRTIVFPAFNLNSTGGYGYTQASLQNLLFYKLENGFKPFVGLEQSFNHRSKIDENGNAVPLKMDALNAYNLDGILGLGWNGHFDEYSFVNFNGGVVATLINTEKRQYFTSSTGETLSYKAPYRFKVFLNSGLYYYLMPNVLFGLEGFYKNSFNKDELGYFGGNLVFKWEF